VAASGITLAKIDIENTTQWSRWLQRLVRCYANRCKRNRLKRLANRAGFESSPNKRVRTFISRNAARGGEALDAGAWLGAFYPPKKKLKTGR